MDTVYVVGLRKSGEPPVVAWDIVGVFTIEEAAAKQCTTKDHFYGPMKLNKVPDKEEKLWEVHSPMLEGD